jgi:hypothetical protein
MKLIVSLLQKYSIKTTFILKLIVFILIIGFVKATFIVFWTSPLFRVAIKDSFNFYSQEESAILISVLTFGLSLFWLTNIILTQLFAITLIPKQIAFVDNWLTQKLKGKPIIQKIIYQFIFYSPLIFFLTTIIRFFIYGDPFTDFFLQSEQYAGAMTMVRGGKIITEHVKSGSSVRMNSTFSYSFDHKFFKQAIPLLLKERQAYKSFHEFLFFFALNNKIAGYDVNSFADTKMNSIKELAAKTAKSILDIKKHIGTLTIKNDSSLNLIFNSLGLFLQKVESYKPENFSRNLDWISKLFANFSQNLAKIDAYVETELLKTYSLHQLREMKDESPSDYFKKMHQIILQHPVILFCYDSTPISSYYKEELKLDLINLWLYEMLFLQKLQFNCDLTSADNLFILATITNGRMVPVQTLAEVATLYFIEDANQKMFPAEFFHFFLRAEKHIQNPDMIRTNSIADMTMLSQRSKQIERGLGGLELKHYDIKSILLSKDVERRTNDELDKSASKVHLTKSPCEKGYTVILTSEKDSKILTSTTYSNGYNQNFSEKKGPYRIFQ